MSHSATPWIITCQSPLFSTISQSLLKYMFTESVMLPNHLILCCPLLLLPSIFPASQSFPMNHLCIRWPSIRASASATVLPVNIHSWFPLGLTGLISLLSKGLSRVFSNATILKHQCFSTQPSLWSNSHIYNMTTGKTIAWQYVPLLAKWCICFLICCHSLS